MCFIVLVGEGLSSWEVRGFGGRGYSIRGHLIQGLCQGGQRGEIIDIMIEYVQKIRNEQILNPVDFLGFIASTREGSQIIHGWGVILKVGG